MQYHYDPIGRIEWVKDARQKQTTWEYRSHPTVREKLRILPGGKSETLKYDRAGNLVQRTDFNCVVTTRTYNEMNRLETVQHPDGEIAFEYEPRGMRSFMADGSTTVFYEHDELCRLTAKDSDHGILNYTYDKLYRVIEEKITGDSNGMDGSSSYTLDLANNRELRDSSIPGIPLTSSYGTYNDRDWLEADQYDDNGNTVRSGPGLSTIDTYDFDNHLTHRNGDNIVINYDGDGERVSKSVSAQAGGPRTTFYLVDDLNPTGAPQVLEELDANHDVVRRYTYGTELLSVDERTEDTSGSVNWISSYYGYDGLGNVRFLTNDAGVITDTYDYDGFGNLISHIGSSPNNYLYQGQQYDSDLGLYYLRARYYNPQTGRFWTMDPFEGVAGGPDGLNKYAYAKANPTSYADPTGNWAFSLPELMVDSQLWFEARKRIRDGFTEAPMELAAIYGSGVMLTASEWLAPPKAQHAWIGSSGYEGQIVGALMDDATQGVRIRDPEQGAMLYVPHQNFFALELADEVNSKVERDVELSQLAVSSMRCELNTNGLLDRQPRNPRYDELNNWLETSYQTGFFKALQLGGDPSNGSMDVTIYPAHTGMGPGAQAASAPTAAAMTSLRPKIAENPTGLFHQAVDYYHMVSTAGLPPEQWAQFMASGGWILQGIAGTVLGLADSFANAPGALASGAYNLLTSPVRTVGRFAAGMGKSAWSAFESFSSGNYAMGVWHANNVVQDALVAIGGASLVARGITAGAKLALRAAASVSRATRGGIIANRTRGMGLNLAAEMLDGTPNSGPKPPRSALGADVSYKDPDPIPHKSGGTTADTPVIDHKRARALGGHPTDSANLARRTWSENSRKGWHEGNYLREKRKLIEGGLTPEQADWALEDYLRWIQNDIHATPVDPRKLDRLPSP